MKSRAFRFRISIRLLLLIVSAVAIWIFFYIPAQNTTLTIPHDKGAYSGLPRKGALVKVLCKTKNRFPTVIGEAEIIDTVDWRFTDGIAMKLRVKATLYQQAQIMRHEFHYIAVLER